MAVKDLNLILHIYHLTPADLPDELQHLTQRRVLASGQILVQQGEKSQYLFSVATGQIRLANCVKQHMITYYFVDAGDLFGQSKNTPFCDGSHKGSPFQPLTLELETAK